MVPENIVWAFFSSSHYQTMADEAVCQGESLPDDMYYQDVSGKWLKVTAIFECIEAARRGYRHSDLKYLGGVLNNTMSKVSRGSVFPPPPKPVNEPEPKPAFDIKKKRRLLKSGIPGTISIKEGKFEKIDMDKMMKYFEDYDTGSYLQRSIS